ncbi:hypothetical protein FQR65_LT07705 [Abscondita terminalis]|nr:hypothetical protein FQR65_LT07705 [Abscondita terminalis]
MERKVWIDSVKINFQILFRSTISHSRYISKIIIKEVNEILEVFTEQIIIKPYRNLNLEKHLLSEVLQKVNRTFRFGIINLGNVEIKIWLPLCGVAAGQSIPILCTINNNSRIFFGGIVFVLTQIEVYRSSLPTKTAKTVRTDVCRVARMVHILRGKYEYYAVLETDQHTPPTNQYYRCRSCQLIYEIWVSVQGAIPRYNAYGYPNIDTPGIPIIIGTHPLYNWNINVITKKVMDYINETRSQTEINGSHADDEVEEILKNDDEEYDKETELNIMRQLVDETIVKTEDVVEDSFKI